MRSYIQGRFIPQNPHKYIGNPNNIVFRSSWERMFMKWADTNPSVLTYASEEMHIGYFCPTDNKMHRYFPDFLITVRGKDGNVQTWMIEIKPFAQTQHPRTKKYKSNKRMIKESMDYAKNQAKWSAATAYCAAKNWKFKIITENELFPK